MVINYDYWVKYRLINFNFLGEATWGGEKTQHSDDYEEDVHPGMAGGPQCKQM